MTTTAVCDLDLEYLRITGEVDIRELGVDEEIMLDMAKLIIMGPTGAGKSSFIQMLTGSNTSLGKISSGGLEGHTQDVTVYKVEEMTYCKCPIYVVDTPGFADDKISAFEITSKLQAFVGGTRSQSTLIPHIMYFTPISITRLPGSQRHVLRMFKAITGPQASGGLTIVTTMWDQLGSAQAMRRAENNFAQLTNDVWKDFIDAGAKITRFYNSKESAIQVLYHALKSGRYQSFHIEKAIQKHIIPSKTTFGLDIYADLIERIQSLNIRRDNIISSMEDPTSNDEIRRILESDLREVDLTIAKFEKQLVDFGPAPKERGRMGRMKDSTKRLVKRIAHFDDVY